MYKIIYNPLSSNNKGFKKVQKLITRLDKNNIEYKLYNFVKLDFNQFMHKCQKDEKIVIAGGDGTVSIFVNMLTGYDFTNQIYLFKAGTGNDFIRNINIKPDLHGLYNITKYIKNLPIVQFGDHKDFFLNGCGIGLDGLVSELSINSKSKNSTTYFRNTIKAIFNYQKVDCDLVIDGEKRKFKNTWMVCIQNGKFFGNGMKIAPKAELKDDLLDLCVIHNIGKFKLVMLFPLVFFGLHIKHKNVFYTRGKDIELIIKDKKTMQIDGEIYTKIDGLKVFR